MLKLAKRSESLVASPSSNVSRKRRICDCIFLSFMAIPFVSGFCGPARPIANAASGGMSYEPSWKQSRMVSRSGCTAYCLGDPEKSMKPRSCSAVHASHAPTTAAPAPS